MQTKLTWNFYNQKFTRSIVVITSIDIISIKYTKTDIGNIYAPLILTARPIIDKVLDIINRAEITITFNIENIS